MFCSTHCWTLVTCSAVFMTICFVTKVVNYSVIKIGCLDLVDFCQQESVFCPWSDRRDLRVISCGENANISDADGLGLRPLSLLPRGRVCIRTVRGHIFPLSRGPCMLENCANWLWSTQKNISRSSVRITACSPGCSHGCFIAPHVLTNKKCILVLWKGVCAALWESFLWIYSTKLVCRHRQ